MKSSVVVTISEPGSMVRPPFKPLIARLSSEESHTMFSLPRTPARRQAFVGKGGSSAGLIQLAGGEDRLTAALSENCGVFG